MRVKNCIVAATLCCMVSCVSEDNYADEQPQQIAFSPVVSNIRSRSPHLVQRPPFGAYAWFGNSDQDLNTQIYMNNVQIREDAQGIWSPVDTYFWPSFGHLDFFCYSPYPEGKTSVRPKITTSPYLVYNKLEYPEIKVDGNTPDFLYSDKTIFQSWETARKGVPIVFNHALAKVVVTVTATMLDEGEEGNTSWDLNLQEFTISNVNHSGSLTMHLANDKKKWKKPMPAVWTKTPDAKEMWNLLPSDASQRKITLETKVLKSAYVVPQILEDDMKLHMKYEIITHHHSGNVADNKWSHELNLDLNSISSQTGPIGAWEMNKVISYHILITPPSKKKPLIFRTEIEDWHSNSSVDEISPKE